MSLWLLTAFYWVHLMATVVWLGGLVLMVAIAWPAWQQQTLNRNQWFQIQKRFIPWANGSLLLLLITGFVQMTTDPNYTGFLQVNSTWGVAILLKHVAFVVLVGASLYWQLYIHPEGERLALLAETRPEKAADAEKKWAQQEITLLRLNLLCALIVLFFTALATAV